MSTLSIVAPCLRYDVFMSGEILMPCGRTEADEEDALSHRYRRGGCKHCDLAERGATTTSPGATSLKPDLPHMV